MDYLTGILSSAITLVTGGPTGPAVDGGASPAAAPAPVPVPVPAAAPSPTNGAPPAPIVVTHEHVSLCSMCMTAPADTLCIPCAHKNGCLDCLTKWKTSNGTCPTCRTRIRELVSVIDAGVPGSPPAPSPLARSSSMPVASTAEARLPPIVTATSVPRVGTLVRCDIPGVPEARPGVDICMLIDVSGSMSTEATREDKDGNVHADGLTVLCVAKHAVRTVCASLKEGDKLAVIAFSDTPRTVVPLTRMNDAGKAAVLSALENMRPSGSTYFWSGIKAGLELLERAADDARHDGRLQSLYCLTDGEPSNEPTIKEAGGAGEGDLHGRAVAHFLETHSAVCAPSVNTFGFGYKLNSKMLLSVARAGGGTFSFIPTAPPMSDIFVHALAATLSAHANRAQLVAPASTIALGSLQMGSSRFVFLSDDSASLDVSLRLPPSAAGGGSIRATHDTVDLATSPGFARMFALESLHRTVIRGLTDMLRIADAASSDEELAATHTLCADLIEELSAPAAQTVVPGLPRTFATDDEVLGGMRRDVSGRVRKAVEGLSRYQRWGGHYLRALLRAYETDSCITPLDPGLQCYAGEFFSQMRDRGMELFRALPAP